MPVDIYFTKEERNKMIFEEYKKGVGYIKLVRTFGLCESTIRKIVKKMKK
ncbi:Mor transcription activator family protein [Intestinibacter sp.]